MMENEFVVSVHCCGTSSPLEPQTQAQVVAPVEHPDCPFGDPATEVSQPRVVFNSSRIFQVPCSCVPQGAGNSNTVASICTSSRPTVVIQGDFALCSSRQNQAYDRLLCSLGKVEDDFKDLASTARQQWEALASTRSRSLTDGVSSAARPTLSSRDDKTGILQDCGTIWDRRLERLGPTRGAYARKLCRAVSRCCRWPCQAAGSPEMCSRTIIRPREYCDLDSVAYPAAAFSLVFHSKPFGLLAFCRDKLGFTSLLAVRGPNQCEKRQCIYLTTSLTSLRMNGAFCKDKSMQAIEVPVDGLWLIDLWELADSMKTRSVTCSPNQMGVEEAMSPDIAPLNGCNVFCIPWEYPSVIRGDHIWCQCDSCAEARGLFWRQRSSFAHVGNGRDEFSWGSGLLEESFLGSLSSLLKSAPGDAFATAACSSELKYGSVVRSAEVLCHLYEHLSSAVSRAIPEALQRILGSSPPDEGNQVADPIFVGILFSGGLDSSLLTGIVLRRLAAAMVQASGLCAAACENPESGSDGKAVETGKHLGGDSGGVFEAASCLLNPAYNCVRDKPDLKGTVVVELVSVSFSSEAPDRLTALRSFEDLLRLLHSLGKPNPSESCVGHERNTAQSCSSVVVGSWALELRLVAVDVSSSDSAVCRGQLLEAIRPKKSHLDLNIAAPLFFASRGAGYLISSSFIQRLEWQTLVQDASVWQPLVIRAPSQPQPNRSQGAASTLVSPDKEFSTLEPTSRRAHIFNASADEIHRGVLPCRVCKRHAKEGCVHHACKLCCEKLRAVAVKLVADGCDEACGEIYVGGRGRVAVSTLGFSASANCRVHRRQTLHCSGTDSNQVGNQGGAGSPTRFTRKVSRPAPFESLTALPCGVALATTEGRRPFMAMSLSELHQWCSEVPNRRACVEIETGTYNIQSSVLLMGSGADELFGGYGRHRTAGITRGLEALRKEQILDLKRIWIRNIGRDARALGVFNRMARFPLLDESLLRFVCSAVPFEHIVEPGLDVRAEAEAIMQQLQKRAVGQLHSGLEVAGDGLSGDPPEHNGGREPYREKEQSSVSDIGSMMCERKLISKGSRGLCCGNKWLLRMCAAISGLSFAAVAKKRAMQFGSRSAKASNRECFPSNRKARGDATFDDGDESS